MEGFFSPLPLSAKVIALLARTPGMGPNSELTNHSVFDDLRAQSLQSLPGYIGIVISLCLRLSVFLMSIVFLQ